MNEEVRQDEEPRQRVDGDLVGRQLDFNGTTRTVVGTVSGNGGSTFVIFDDGTLALEGTVRDSSKDVTENTEDTES